MPIPVRFVALVLPLGLAALGCEDPAAQVPPAAVNSAKPQATATAAATAKATASAATTASAAPTASAASSAAALPPAPAKPEGALDITPKDSKIEWTGSKVTGKHDGDFKTFSGFIAMKDDKPENAQVYVEIDTDSVTSDQEKLTGHLKSADFFDTAKFPKATFTSTEIKAGGEKGATHTITGNLNLHGVEKSITIPATIKVAADHVEAKSEFSINRKDFQIVYAGKPDDLIRDGVVIRLDLKAARPKK